ncbi:MAG: IS1595 family transposase [bacterium]
MEDYPENIMEFEKRFGTEEACRDYLFKLRWPDGFTGPRCNHEKAWPLKKCLYQCANCDHKISVIAGTIFHGTHKSLVLWFRAIWWLTGQKNGASALCIQRMMGLGSYKTAWAWLHKLRRAMITPGRDNLTGVVEVDETYIGGEKPGKRGRGAERKSLVVIAVEINSSKIGRIRLRKVPDASFESLSNAIDKTINKGSLIQTDGWSGYNHLKSLGYFHEIIRQNSEVGENLLPNCHLVASLVKRWLAGTHQGAVSHQHLEYYLDEFTFRFNRRTSAHRGKLFYRLLQNAVSIEPVPFNQIKKNVKND